MPFRSPVRHAASAADLARLRTLADQTLSRTAGAPLSGGNQVRVLRNAAENYPAWEHAIRAASRAIHVEMYIVRDDDTGRRFVSLLVERARAGVRVRVVYDWFGCGWAPARGIFRPLVAAGGDVRAFNPPALGNALGWVRRNHRKLVTVDGAVAFVSGLCVGDEWTGRPERGLDPWRDTGLEITGPAAAEADASFAESWARVGGEAIEPAAPPAAAGDVDLRLIPTEPFTGNMLRLDLLVASVARRSLWITDAYFIGTGPYLEALRRAARDGVDVRLLLPRGSDVGWVVPVSRSLYRPLLEAGVRIFEWNGTMVHAKSAVADTRWARVGSTNLNLNSWMGNWELDVAIENEAIAREMERHFEDDLTNATEIVLTTAAARPRPRPAPRQPGAARTRRASRRLVRTVTGVGRSIGAAVSGNRPLESFEAVPLALASVLLIATAALGFFFPRVLAWPAAALALWIGATFIVEAWRARRHP